MHRAQVLPGVVLVYQFVIHHNNLLHQSAHFLCICITNICKALHYVRYQDPAAIHVLFVLKEYWAHPVNNVPHPSLPQFKYLCEGDVMLSECRTDGMCLYYNI